MLASISNEQLISVVGGQQAAPDRQQDPQLASCFLGAASRSQGLPPRNLAKPHGAFEFVETLVPSTGGRNYMVDANRCHL
jgi:hypothetical protein